ncbi:MAG: spore coat protein [Bacteroidetes bacterium]|nr:spore coat protein [Bacteroidota bacterium]
MKRLSSNLIVLNVLLFISLGCQEDILVPSSGAVLEFNDTDFTPDDWTEDTHNKIKDPFYDEVFDSTQVKRLDIVINLDRWQLMTENMTNLFGTFGVSTNTGAGGGPPPAAGAIDDTEDPLFVPADVFYKGKQWYRVGVRFKGNSSLQSTWSNGNLKLSFKLDFDQFEDIYPQILNQRFYGFKKLSLKNNYDDKAFIREKVGADIFRRAGLVVSQSSFYTVYVDFGNKPVYFGLYTLVEEVDDTVIKEKYKNNNGNLYKPENAGSSFALGTFSEKDFEKKTNEELADWSDIKQLFSVLHNANRTTNASLWRQNLDAIFDTDVFLNYLAVNTAIQNWDTYGRMQHNYFLYVNPKSNKFEWIPWDNNEALQFGKMQGSLNLDFSNLQSDSWPLIEFLYNDPVYKAKYDAYLKNVVENAFNADEISAVYNRYASLIKEFATSEQRGYTFLANTSEFQQAISTLKSHVVSRNQAIQNYLN